MDMIQAYALQTLCAYVACVGFAVFLGVIAKTFLIDPGIAYLGARAWAYIDRKREATDHMNGSER